MATTLHTQAALEHFEKNDAVMALLLTKALSGDSPLILPVTKEPNEYFASIVSSVVSQQISTHAARAIKARVVEALGGTVTPQSVTAIQFDTLKACGLSEKKTTYLKHNAAIWHEIPVENFTKMTNEEIITELTKLYGIGRWTAEMFLIFSLARPDVFSYGDLALMNGLYTHYPIKPHYTKRMKNTVDSWSPHKTIASLLLWHSKDTIVWE